MASGLRRETGPIIENLKETRDLRAEITGNAADRIFQYTHAAKVAGPDNRGENWAKLAAALAGFNAELGKVAEIHNEKYTAEGLAVGARHGLENNRKAWEEFAGEHPEIAGLNPHVERGYKGAHLRGKAQDLQDHLRAKAIEDGWINETDPARVRELTNAAVLAWEAENLDLDAYGPRLLADNYLAGRERAVGALLDENTTRRNREHLNRAAQEHGADFGRGLSELMGVADFGNPADRVRLQVEVPALIKAKLQEMTASGVPQSSARTDLINSGLALAEAEGEAGYGDELLELLREAGLGDAKLGDLPEFKLAAAKLQEKWKRDYRQDLLEQRQLLRLRREEETEKARNSVAVALTDSLKSGAPMPDLEALLALPGVKPEHLADINVIRNSYIAAATHKPPMTASRLIDWTIDSNLVREGKLTPDKLLEKRACYDDEHFMALFNSAVAVQSGNDPMGRIFNSAGGQRAVKFLEAQMKAEGNAVDPALLEEARFELYARTEAWRGKEIRRTPDLGDSEVYAFMMEEAQKLGKEPAYRLDALERDLQTPAQTRERQSPEYWEKNERRSLGEPGAAKAVIKGYIQSPEETTRQLAARLNLPEAAIESFIGNQAKLYGLDLPGLIQEYRAYQAAEAKAKLALLGGPNSMFIK